MTADLAERLRAESRFMLADLNGGTMALLREAADVIDSLTKERDTALAAELREANFRIKVCGEMEEKWLAAESRYEELLRSQDQHSAKQVED